MIARRPSLISRSSSPIDYSSRPNSIYSFFFPLHANARSRIIFLSEIERSSLSRRARRDISQWPRVSTRFISRGQYVVLRRGGLSALPLHLSYSHKMEPRFVREGRFKPSLLQNFTRMPLETSRASVSVQSFKHPYRFLGPVGSVGDLSARILLEISKAWVAKALRGERVG